MAPPGASNRRTATPPKSRPKSARDSPKSAGDKKKKASPSKNAAAAATEAAPIDWDSKLGALQKARDAADALLLDTAWYGPYAKRFSRRADTLEQCRIFIQGRGGGYPCLCFIVGEPGKPTTVFAQQGFFLQNQWESGTAYWATDAGIHGVLQARLGAGDEELLKLAETVPGGVSKDDFMSPFTEEEHAAVEQCVVAPLVLLLDKAVATAGASLRTGPNDMLSASGFALGETVMDAEEEAGGSEDERPWRREVYVRGDVADRAAIRRAFQALQLLPVAFFAPRD